MTEMGREKKGWKREEEDWWGEDGNCRRGGLVDAGKMEVSRVETRVGGE